LISPEKMKDPFDQTTVSAMTKLLRGSIVITASLIVLQSMGYSIAGVLTFGGIGGIAIGFAAKDLLANFFGGLMIYLDRPFIVGDWVRSPDKNIEGTVEMIGWRLTTIRTFDKRPLYVPNATFATISVENPSRMSHRRIYETIGIRYQDAHLMDKITAEIKQMLIADDEIDSEQTLIVNFTQFNASSLDIMVYTFTTTTDWIHFQEIKHRILLKIYAIISAQGANIAFPTQTLHHASIPSLALSATNNGIDEIKNP
jgi:MscS family membrane protein